MDDEEYSSIVSWHLNSSNLNSNRMCLFSHHIRGFLSSYHLKRWITCVFLQAMGEPLYRVSTGNYEYRLVLRCRQEARARFAKMRKDVMEKIELLDQKHGLLLLFLFFLRYSLHQRPVLRNWICCQQSNFRVNSGFYSAGSLLTGVHRHGNFHLMSVIIEIIS